VPIYEYEPDGHECFICSGRVEAIQAIGDEPLRFCPTCGLEVRKVVSKAAIKIARPSGAQRAADKGFTTWKRAEKGTWEKVAGGGVDYMVGDPSDVASLDAEKNPPKKLDLDKAD